MAKSGNTVNAKGQVLIPAELRRKLGVKKGTRLAIFEEDGKIILMPLQELARSLRGVLRGRGYTYKDFLRQRHQDRY